MKAKRVILYIILVVLVVRVGCGKEVPESEEKVSESLSKSEELFKNLQEKVFLGSGIMIDFTNAYSYPIN